MNKKGFFEYLGLADMEKVHSQILAWLLSENCSVLNPSQKSQIIQKIIGTKNVGAIKIVHTEHKGIDILVETENEWLVIENKIKSSQHSNQLEEYEKVMASIKDDKNVYYIFLTLISEKAKQPWVNFSYKELVKTITDFNLNLSVNGDSIIFSEYLNYLTQITTAVDDFLSDPSTHKNVFTDGHLSKFEKAKRHYTGTEKFISENQLETILQKCYFAPIVEQLAVSYPGYDFSISDTRGVALINAFDKNDLVYQDRAYKVGIQYQGGTWKFAMSIAADYLDSKKEWLSPLFPLFKHFKKEKRFDYYQYNSPDTKAWVSVSKKMEKEIYSMNPSEFIKLYGQELVHCKQLKAEILNNI